MFDNFLENCGDTLCSANNFMDLRVNNSRERLICDIDFSSEIRFKRNSLTWQLPACLRRHRDITSNMCRRCGILYGRDMRLDFKKKHSRWWRGSNLGKLSNADSTIMKII